MIMVLLPLKSILVSLSIIYRYAELYKSRIKMSIISTKAVVSALEFMHVTLYARQRS